MPHLSSGPESFITEMAKHLTSPRASLNTLSRHKSDGSRRASERQIPWPVPRLSPVPLGTRATHWLIDHGYLTDRVVRIFEFPKSGGTWLAQLLATTLEWPFLDNSALPPDNNCVLRGHNLAHGRSGRLIYMVRDPRDVYVSLYHHRIRHYRGNVSYRRAQISAMGEPLNPRSIREQFDSFLRFEQQYAGRRGSSTPASWSTHVRSFTPSLTDPAKALVSYESLKEDTAGELARLYQELFAHELPKGLAERVAKAHDYRIRKTLQGAPRRGRSAIRVGRTGGWRDVFTRSSGQILTEHAGDMMLKYGYVQSRNWWRDLPRRD